jgi:hypothetical protein
MTPAESVAERVVEIADLRTMRPPRSAPSSEFLEHVIGKPGRVLHASTATALSGRIPVRDRASQVAQAAHVAFSEHHAFTLSPEIVWYLVVHEIATHVAQDARRYAALFGREPDVRTLLRVEDDSLTGGPHDDWGYTVQLFEAPLRELVGDEMLDLLLPRLSTMGRDDTVTLLLAFMDTVQPYFQYRVRSLCGIPRVRLRGTADDWATISQRLGRLTRLFPPLEPWLAEAGSVVEQIHATASGRTPEMKFWESLYKYEGRSGGPEISGWITAFLAHVLTPDGPVLREDFGPSPRRGPWGPLLGVELTALVCRVPFIWERGIPVVERPMVFAAGVLGVDCEDGLTPRLGWAVAEAGVH